MDANSRRSAGGRLVLQAHQPLEMVLQVAVSGSRVAPATTRESSNVSR